MSVRISPLTASANRKTYSSTSVTFDTVMLVDWYYVFTATTPCYIAQHATAPVASVGDGSTYIPAGASVLIFGAIGAKLAVIRAGAVDGEATLTAAVLT